MAILNMVGGGSGGLKATDAILRVIAPAGSTVTISKGGVSKSDLGHENASDTSLYDYYFIIHASQFDSVNPWTVTATLGSDTASKTIIIDSADEYDVVLGYWVKLFDYAIDGFNAIKNNLVAMNDSAYSPITDGGDHVICTGGGNSGIIRAWYYNTPFLANSYNSVKFDGYVTSTSVTNHYIAVRNTAQTGYDKIPLVSARVDINATLRSDHYLDISSVSDQNLYFQMTNNNMAFHVYSVYLVP